MANFTTLSAAVNATQNYVTLASGTGVVLPTLGPNGSYLFVDDEAMQVVTNPATGMYTVKRGVQATNNASHINGAPVRIDSSVSSSGDSSRPYSTSAQLFGRANSPSTFQYPGPSAMTSWGPAGLGLVAGNSTTPTSGTTYFVQVDIQQDSNVTNLSVLNGATIGTNAWLLAIYDALGNLLGNTALAGTTSAGVSIFQTIVLVTPVYCKAGTYYLAFQTNGNTDRFMTIPAGGGFALTGSKTGTFGTLVNPITIPTTFTANVGPIMFTS